MRIIASDGYGLRPLKDLPAPRKAKAKRAAPAKPATPEKQTGPAPDAKKRGA